MGKLKISTARGRSCGTDQTVKAMLVGKNGLTTGWHLLDKAGYNDFEQGDVDDYVITSATPFIPNKLCLQGDGWCVKPNEGVKIYNADLTEVKGRIGAANNFPDLMHHQVHCVRIVSGQPASTLVPIPVSTPVSTLTRRFKLKISTARGRSCGTDQKVKAMLVGKNGLTTGWHLLDKAGYNDFEQGDVDDYVITSATPFIPNILCLQGDGWCVKPNEGVQIYNADLTEANGRIGAANNFPDLMHHNVHCVRIVF